MAQRVSARLSVAPARRFGLTVGPAFAALGGVLLWRQHPGAAATAAVLAGVLVVAALVVPGALVPVERLWMRAAHAISIVTTPLVMGVVYFVVLAPVALVMRRVRGNPLQRAAHRGGFWVSRALEQGRRGGMDRQF